MGCECLPILQRLLILKNFGRRIVAMDIKTYRPFLGCLIFHLEFIPVHRKINCTALSIFVQVDICFPTILEVSLTSRAQTVNGGSIGWVSKHKSLDTDVCWIFHPKLLYFDLTVHSIAIWSSNKYIVGGLILAIIGQWSLIFQGHLICKRKLAQFSSCSFWFVVGHLKADWTADNLHCVSKSTNKKILSAFFIYAMCLDLIVLLLTSYKLFVLNPSKISGKSRIAQMIYVDGISFFVVASV